MSRTGAWSQLPRHAGQIYVDSNSLGLASVSEILDLDRIDGLCQFEAEYFRVEIEFGFEHALDVLGFAKTMLFALERQIGDRQLFGAHGGDHFLRLIGRDDFVFQALEDDYGAI